MFKNIKRLWRYLFRTRYRIINLYGMYRVELRPWNDTWWHLLDDRWYVTQEEAELALIALKEPLPKKEKPVVVHEE